MNTTPDQREKLAAKLRALMALAKDAGATEAEAFSAAQKARELMDKYNMDMTEAEIRADPLITDTRWSEGRYDDYAKVGIPHAVSQFTDTRIWINRNGALVILGCRQDVEFARWLLDTLMSYVSRGAHAYPGSQTDKRNFAISACARIAKRMMDEIEARKRADAFKHQSLVLVTKAVMQTDWLNQQGMRLGKAQKKSFAPNSDGFAHGDAARWDRPIRSGEEQRRLK